MSVREIALFDEGTPATTRHELFLLENVPAIFDQRQSVEHLGGERHRLSLAQKHALSFVDAKPAELVEVLGPLDHARPHNFLRTS